MFGALSPSEARSASEDLGAAAKHEDKDEKSEKEKSKQQRNVSQAELESSLYRVGNPTNSLLSDIAFKVCSRLS